MVYNGLGNFDSQDRDRPLESVNYQVVLGFAVGFGVVSHLNVYLNEVAVSVQGQVLLVLAGYSLLVVLNIEVVILILDESLNEHLRLVPENRVISYKRFVVRR